MARPKLRVVTVDEVTIRRKGDTAVIEYADPEMGGGMNFQVGPELRNLTDLEVIEMHNDMIRRMQAHREANPYVAVEIPDGKPQIERSKNTGYWTTRGDVLRCYIESSTESANIPVIDIDGRKLSWCEFGELVSVHEGWGMRLAFVPDDELDKPPCIALRNSKKDRRGLPRLRKIKTKGAA